MGAVLRLDGRANPAPVTPGRWRAALALGLLATLLACGGGGGGGDDALVPPSTMCPPSAARAVDGPAWPGFARDAQHSALGDPSLGTQSLACIFWQTPVDLAPQLTASGALLTHYGSPLITARNTVLVPLKTGSNGGFVVEARSGHDGSLKWTQASDYRLPPHRWVPSYNPVLAPPRVAGGPPRLVMPMAGGRVLVREDPDDATGTTRELSFFDDGGTPAAYTGTVFINTPITADSRGNLFFGFQVTGANPANLAGGIARIGTDGRGSWVAAAVASGSAAFVKPQTNGAPALSNDESLLYVVVNTAGNNPAGRLLALDTTTLATQNVRDLLDPATNAPAWVSDDSTASPTIGFDGDVFVGVLESNAPAHHFRGWLLHFNRTLTESRTPASFGWDTTASVVPAAMVPQYRGSSSYLLLTKYNDYGGGAGGDGRNRVAVLEPNPAQTQADPIIPSVRVMPEVLSQLGPTPDPEHPPLGVKEWCINTAAVDPATQSVLINSEDGYLYRWHLPSDSFAERIQLNPGRAQSYTPTAIGPDGRVYAVNNATLHSIGKP